MLPRVTRSAFFDSRATMVVAMAAWPAGPRPKWPE